MLAVTAVGADQPGIIARVTEVLLAHDGNLADSTMTILGGQFAIVLLVDTAAAPAALEAALIEATADLGLVVAVRPVGPGHDSPPATHMVSVYGADRPGIVHAVTAALAQHEINITDLETAVVEGEEPVYVMLLEVSLPADADVVALTANLHDTVGLDVTIEPLDTATF